MRQDFGDPLPPHLRELGPGGLFQDVLLAPEPELTRAVAPPAEPAPPAPANQELPLPPPMEPLPPPTAAEQGSCLIRAGQRSLSYRLVDCACWCCLQVGGLPCAVWWPVTLCFAQCRWGQSRAGRRQHWRDPTPRLEPGRQRTASSPPCLPNLSGSTGLPTVRTRHQHDTVDEVSRQFSGYSVIPASIYRVPSL